MNSDKNEKIEDLFNRLFDFINNKESFLNNLSDEDIEDGVLKMGGKHLAEMANPYMQGIFAVYCATGNRAAMNSSIKQFAELQVDALVMAGMKGVPEREKAIEQIVMSCMDGINKTAAEHTGHGEDCPIKRLLVKNCQESDDGVLDATEVM